ncbi:MAG: glycosyltransferase [Hahellaceae bacterium]|nr:glycosyltransferase [Hahellaceae bacterium]
MSEKPLISVLINNYNYADYIEEAVESVLKQTYQNFELIIVDDGSTDHSKAVIEQLVVPGLVKIYKENGGQGSAFNAGFAASKGEIICFLDSDDWWKPGKLEEIVKWHHFLQGNYALLQHNVDVWDGGKVYPFKEAMLSGDCFSLTRRTDELAFFVGTSGLAFKRTVLEQLLPVPANFRISADAYLTRTSYTKGLVYSIPYSLGYYRKHNNAVLGNTRYDHSRFHRTVLFPALNEFNKANGIGYRYSVKPKAKKIDNKILGYLLRVRDLWSIKKLSSEIKRFHKDTKVMVYGAGTVAVKVLPRLAEHVACIVDMDDRRDGEEFYGKQIISLSKMHRHEYDYILVTPLHRERDIISMLTAEYEVPIEKVLVI